MIHPVTVQGAQWPYHRQRNFSLASFICASQNTTVEITFQRWVHLSLVRLQFVPVWSQFFYSRVEPTQRMCISLLTDDDKIPLILTSRSSDDCSMTRTGHVESNLGAKLRRKTSGFHIKSERADHWSTRIQKKRDSRKKELCLRSRLYVRVENFPLDKVEHIRTNPELIKSGFARHSLSCNICIFRWSNLYFLETVVRWPLAG